MKHVTMTCMLALLLAFSHQAAVAQTTIKIDGDMSDWTEEMRIDVPPNRPIITWQDGADGRDNSPADPNNLSFMVDLNFAGVYATDDKDNLYVRVLMNPLADVRRILTDVEMYPSNARIELYLSVDPDLLQDFADTTGMTWGWYFSGQDFLVGLYPFDEAYMDSTGYQNPLREHTQQNNEYDFDAIHPAGGARIAWNAAYNEVELAIPKAVLLAPRFIEDFDGSDFVALLLMSGAHNTAQDDPWWSQRIASNDNILGYVYAYEEEWTTSSEAMEVAGMFSLEQNYPNPLNASTTIRFTMERAANVQVEVFDVLGRQRATLLDAMITPGQHAVEFNADGLESGTYLYRVTADGVSATRTMLVVK